MNGQGTTLPLYTIPHVDIRVLDIFHTGAGQVREVPECQCRSPRPRQVSHMLVSKKSQTPEVEDCTTEPRGKQHITQELSLSQEGRSAKCVYKIQPRRHEQTSMEKTNILTVEGTTCVHQSKELARDIRREWGHHPSSNHRKCTRSPSTRHSRM